MFQYISIFYARHAELDALEYAQFLNERKGFLAKSKFIVGFGNN